MEKIHNYSDLSDVIFENYQAPDLTEPICSTKIFRRQCAEILLARSSHDIDRIFFLKKLAARVRF